MVIYVMDGVSRLTIDCVTLNEIYTSYGRGNSEGSKVPDSGVL